uniref:Uncharacterized protein n=1 Tax=Anopheles minimus TaxID=112268 RepID=A0A182WMU7_9DIPT
AERKCNTHTNEARTLFLVQLTVAYGRSLNFARHFVWFPV